ncbi:hypothetical protein AYI70_g1585 [Smittium culicis]|uniref:Uncharacterized protein n=1 Tax=Smittium culicis TaxID=133412 RepID=A0A1R1YC87_9FUNG|nr:hypothetical protein AYI70_g1585 [Smittium culicis]
MSIIKKKLLPETLYDRSSKFGKKEYAFNAVTSFTEPSALRGVFKSVYNFTYTFIVNLLFVAVYPFFLFFFIPFLVDFFS